MAKLSLLSLNVRGLQTLETRRETFHWLKSKKVDIVFLQETHSIEEDEESWSKDWEGRILFSHGKTDARGTAILLKKHLDYFIHDHKADTNGRYVVADISVHDTRCTVANLYGPNDDDANFFTNIAGIIDNFGNSKVIIGGDFNCTLNRLIDRKGASNFDSCKRKRALLQTWMEEAELVDIWRQLNPDKKRFTWYRRRPRPVFSRLDYFVISFDLVNATINADIKPGYKSDHSAITLELQLVERPRGNGHWKINFF